MVDFAGWQMPVQYTSIIAEHRAVRQAAGLFDVSHMGEVELSGAGARAACARLFTNHAATLSAGRAIYSLLCDDRGRILDDVIVYCLAERRFLVCVNASNAERDATWIASHAGPECIVTDRSETLALLALQGPAAASILSPLASQVAVLDRFGVTEIPIGGVPVTVARTGYTGEDGFELFVEGTHAQRLWSLLLDRGASQGLVPAGLGARDTLRLEAALPLYGHEIDEQISPWEARLGWAVKLDRPEMVGYEALVARKREPLRRRSVGLAVEGGIARNGHRVLSAGAPVGIVTSGSYAPTVARAIALALIDTTAIDADLWVEVRGKPCRARVTSLPFYARKV